MSVLEAPGSAVLEVPDSGPLFSFSFMFSLSFPLWNDPVKDLSAVSGCKVLALLPVFK